MLRAGGLLALGGGVAPLTGCDLLDRDDGPPPAPDPLRPLLDEALTLAASYRAAAGAVPDLADRLTPIAEAHQAHAAELARVIGVTLPSTAPASTGTPPTGPDAALAELRQREQAGREAAVTACAAAPAERAALLGSVAAARATHLEALK
ncbi:hypothetical protein [Micromonospora sp. WMMD812]|uniref:hypothetical protein n=1 Tax=Micromonospora sp. WMMD812 TaxID=3015152 RepID=UPI00248C017B|nr:hypothetical protein [Micromonospora sp. WMMD812]WBB70955.1 hypothetical protein O7603_13890 [Micromonospora sp. WMMD812]